MAEQDDLPPVYASLVVDILNILLDAPGIVIAGFRRRAGEVEYPSEPDFRVTGVCMITGL